MKQITLLLLTLLITSVGYSQILSNGGFETGDLTDWELGYAASVETTHGEMTPHGGTYFAKKNKWGGTLLRNDFTVIPNTTYTVTFWYAADGESNAPGNFRMGDQTGSSPVWLPLTPIIADNGENAVDNTLYGAVNLLSNANTWTEGSYTFTTSTTMTTARFNWWSDTNVFYYLDDVSVVVTSSGGIEDLEKFNFSFYPNPVKDNLSLSASESIEHIEIYSILGQQVLVKELNMTKANLDISNLTEGAYIIKATINGAVGTYKFIKE